MTTRADAPLTAMEEIDFTSSREGEQEGGLQKDADEETVLADQVKSELVDEKSATHQGLVEEADGLDELQVSAAELEALEEKLSAMSLERTYHIIKQARELHKHDQNFPGSVLSSMKAFLDNPEVMRNPEQYDQLVREVKLEAILSVENSPYQEVRANVDPTDDTTLPSFTFRVFVIGTIFSGIGAFVDTFFIIRQPAITVGMNVGQIFAYPAGRFMEWVLPCREMSILGWHFSLNPGPFSRKEHMLIAIMSQVSFASPYTGYLVMAQALPQYFGQSFARDFGYQILATFGINFCGFGLSGIARRFLVYPSVCIWPSSLVTVALNHAFHNRANEPVKGPFNRMYRRSQESVLLWGVGLMFAWYFLPGYLFTALSTFSWMSWIAPHNATLNNIVGFKNGLGLNPLSTFDWNIPTANQFQTLTIPFFSVANAVFGLVIWTLISIGLYFTNTWQTSYLPINSNTIYANNGATFNVSRVTGPNGHFDAVKYQNYSEPWLSAGYLAYLFFSFAMYTSCIAYVAFNHRHDLSIGFRSAWRSTIRSIRRTPHTWEEEDDLYEDIHARLMRTYPEVPEWWYLIVLAVSVICGMTAMGCWPTETSPVVVIFGLIMCLICILPCGLVQAVTGISVPTQNLSLFIGSAFTSGNGMAIMAWKSWGYISLYQAVYFCNDLKLGHYLKIPPRHTFAAQLWGHIVNAFIGTALFNFQMSFKDVCTPNATFRFTCPGANNFYTGGVFWGTLGLKHLFGPGKRYNMLLLGFPVGVVIVLIHYALRRAFPRTEWIRQIHPPIICTAPVWFGSPYNLSYFFPNLWLTWVSFQYIRKRWPQFFAKYNYVIAAAFPSGVALGAIIIFFCLNVPHGGVHLNWWGNKVASQGCEGTPCRRLPIPKVGYFGPAPGTNSFG